MVGRCIFIHRLGPVIKAEGTLQNVMEKAVRAGLKGLWVKVADGLSKSVNIKDPVRADFIKLVESAHGLGILVWGWQVPHCPDESTAVAEANLLADIVSDFQLDGAMADVEAGSQFFLGGVKEAKAYAEKLGKRMKDSGKSSAISSHDIPQGQGGFLPIFNECVQHLDYNVPQVYYGGSPSVANRLGRAQKANAHIAKPFIPAGAAWVSNEPDGGCASASACAERAREFIRLVKECGYEGYSFWHWHGAPLAFWEVLNTVK